MNTSHGAHATQEHLAPRSQTITGKVAIQAGSTTPFPDEAGVYVRFKASPDNQGRVFLHGDGGSSMDGWPLEAGQETGLLPLENLNLYAHSGAQAGDEVYYEVIR